MQIKYQVLNKYLILIIFLSLGCGQGFKLEGFDQEKWQLDVDGCNLDRPSMADRLIERKSELIGRSQNEIIDLFGKPSRLELYSRNKKAFVYFISGGPACDDKNESTKKLVIRFDGVGRSKEIILYKN